MAGIKEVLRVGGPQASRGVGMMTAAFAVGQIAGPLSVSLFAGSGNAFAITSIIAALGLVLGNCVLSIDDARLLSQYRINSGEDVTPPPIAPLLTDVETKIP
jgi:hypothetical protein